MPRPSEALPPAPSPFLPDTSAFLPRAEIGAAAVRRGEAGGEEVVLDGRGPWAKREGSRGLPFSTEESEGPLFSREGSRGQRVERGALDSRGMETRDG